MAELSLGDIFAEADAEVYESWEPPDGWAGVMVVTRTNTGKTTTGSVKWGLFLRVDGGPDDGKTMWDNIYIDPTGKSKGNGPNVGKLRAAGITREDMDLGPDHVADALVDRVFKVTVKHNEKNGNVYKNLRYSPIEKQQPTEPKKLSFDD